jgi:hypothetical protein
MKTMQEPVSGEAVLVGEGYSRDEVILILSRLRRKLNRPPLSIPTFYRWLDLLSISPKFRYSDVELKRLAALCRHFSQGGKTSNLPAV